MAERPIRLKRSGLTMPIVTERFINNAWHRGCDYINMDLRFGWRARPAEGDTLDIYFDLINVFNRPNFFVASWANGDQNSGNFSRYTLLRSGGVPRQANFGIRYGF